MSKEKVCDLKYLKEMVYGKNTLVLEIFDVFLKQVPDELQNINNAIAESEFTKIKKFAHKMKSSVSIMGISLLVPILKEMEDLGAKKTDIKKIQELNQKLNSICMMAVEEIENEKKTIVEN